MLVSGSDIFNDMHKVFTTFSGGKKLIPEGNIVRRHAASGVVIDGSRILLIGLKNSDKLWFPGGTIEDGETSEEATKREVKEEAGIDVEVGELLVEVQNNFYYEPLDKAWEQHEKFYVCRPLSTEITDFTNPDTLDEAAGPRWVELESIQGEDMQDYGLEVVKLILEK